jgi:hypothetical protein
MDHQVKQLFRFRLETQSLFFYTAVMATSLYMSLIYGELFPSVNIGVVEAFFKRIGRN